MPDYAERHILGIIPARGGSKGIPRKNVRLLAGRPLIHYTFTAARASRLLTRTILTTDSLEIAQLGTEAGVEVPMIRPARLAADDTPMRAVIGQALDWLAGGEGYVPDLVVILQPTAPLRAAEHIDQAIELLLTSDADSVVSVTPVPGHYNPHWQFRIEDGLLRTFTGEPLTGIITRRQELPVTYTRNGAVYCFRRVAWEETGSIYGTRCLPYVMPPDLSVNVDTMDDWSQAEAFLAESRGRR